MNHASTKTRISGWIVRRKLIILKSLGAIKRNGLKSMPKSINVTYSLWR